jgi:putative sugar O-methyltransferase
MNRALRPLDLELARHSQLEALRADLAEATPSLDSLYRPSFSNAPLPDGAAEYLRPDNPKLLELKERYRDHPAASHSQWSEEYLKANLDLQHFRGDNAYLYQVSVASPAQYLLSTCYLRSMDRMGLFESLTDDAAFGNYVLPVDDEGHVTSRDLIDSIAELEFLEEQIGISQVPDLTVLDIGAGYGRLANRFVQALPNLRSVLCTDAIAESTFVCEYYLRFRSVEHKAMVVPLDEVETALSKTSITLVTNVHSFSECTFASVVWWLDQIRSHNARYVFIVPNHDQLLAKEIDGTKTDFLPELIARGYELVARQPNYRQAAVQRFGGFAAEFYLFRLRDA